MKNDRSVYTFLVSIFFLLLFRFEMLQPEYNIINDKECARTDWTDTNDGLKQARGYFSLSSFLSPSILVYHKKFNECKSENIIYIYIYISFNSRGSRRCLPRRGAPVVVFASAESAAGKWSRVMNARMTDRYGLHRKDLFSLSFFFFFIFLWWCDNRCESRVSKNQLSRSF